MYKSKVPIMAAALLICSGCPIKGGGGGGTTAFKLNFDPVTGVFVSGGGIAEPGATSNAPSPTPVPDPTLPPTFAQVTVEGQGTVDGNAYGSLTLEFSASIDSVIGCQQLAAQAQQENRQLEVEGVGTVV